MLQKLSIKNYAIIDHLVIEPDGHLNTVTGETGAGKSIILGALSLILGERADSSVLINKEEKCVVEGYFDVKHNEAFNRALKEEELDEEAQCIIRREISTSGKSRAFVNDTPVTLSVLNRLSSLLIDLHQQFGHLALEDDHFQMNVLDAVAGNADMLKEYTAGYTAYKKISQQIIEYKAQQTQWQKEADYKQYLLDELLQLNFKTGEIEEAEQQLKQMTHAERIMSVLQMSRQVLDEGEQPLANELKRIAQQLQGITDVMQDAEPLQERILSAYAELKDIAGELEILEGKINLDAGLMQQLQERMDAGYKLLKKHALQNTDELLVLQQQLEEELKASRDLNDHINKLEQEQASVYAEVLSIAKHIAKARRKTAPEIAARVTELLALVGMPNARFDIALKDVAEPNAKGLDEVSFLLDANKSGVFQPVYKAASGGEMSRIMLCIKSLTAKAMHMPTLIFDEVDTGISGEAARQVAILLRDLSEYHQVICITHQPQVAAKGSRHFYVYKDEDSKARITTKVRVLKQDERVLAIARMIGGEQPSDAALQNAKELVEA
ncbi:MAG: DNA repair protein RecN [Bacteroidetes bacterium 46-16]|nr:MAG: DNA repair protein RecN [Bacteroidetes bacterium 46-16]